MKSPSISQGENHVEERRTAEQRTVVSHARGLEKIREVFGDVADRIRFALYPDDPLLKVQVATITADKEMKKEVRRVPGGRKAFLKKMGDVSWMKPLIHMASSAADELHLGKSVLIVDFKGYSTLLAEGKIPPDILLQFMARFYAGVTGIAQSNGGLLYRTPMGDRVEFAFDDPLKAEAVAQKVKFFMDNDFYDKEWKKRLSYFGVSENKHFEAPSIPQSNTCAVIKFFRFSPRRILPIYTTERINETSPVRRVDGLDFERNMGTAIRTAQLCPMRPTAMMTEKPDMAKEYKFIASLQCVNEGKFLFTEGSAEMQQKIADAIFKECSEHSLIQVFKTGEKGELVFFSRNPSELLQFIWKISRICSTHNVQCKAGIFGGVFYASEIYPEVQRGWPDVHGEAYARAIRATSIGKVEKKDDVVAEIKIEIVVGPEVMDRVEMDAGSTVTPHVVLFKNMGSYTVHAINNIVGNVKLREAPAQDIGELKRKLVETRTGKVQFQGDFKSACNALKQEGHESIYVECSLHVDIARKIAMQVIPLLEQNRRDSPMSEEDIGKIIAQIQKNPRDFVTRLEAHKIYINVFLEYSSELSANQCVFINKLLELTKGTKIIRIVSDERLKEPLSAPKLKTEQDVRAQGNYARFAADHKTSVEENELITLFFLIGGSLTIGSVSKFCPDKKINVLEKILGHLVSKRILKFDKGKKEWSLAVDSELLEGCQIRELGASDNFYNAIGKNRLASLGLFPDPKEKMPRLGRAIEYLAAPQKPDVVILMPAIDEMIGLCDSVRDFKLAFEYVNKKLEIWERTTTREARGITPSSLNEKKKILMERAIRARNLNYQVEHMDSLRQLLGNEMNAVLSPSEKMRLRMHFLTALTQIDRPQAQAEFDRTKEELYSLPLSEDTNGVDPGLLTQFQHLAEMLALYKKPSEGKIHKQDPLFYESFINSLAAFCDQYGDLLDPYAAVTIAKIITACVHFYDIQHGEDYAKMGTWLRFAEEIENRYRERFIAKERLTKDIGKFLYNLASSYVSIARTREQMKDHAVAANILRHARALRSYAAENSDDENLYLSLHLEVTLLNHQDKHAETWELFKELLNFDLEPAQAAILYVNAAEYIYKLKETPEGDLTLARHYLIKSYKLLFELGMEPPEFHIKEFKKWDKLVAEALGVEPLFTANSNSLKTAA